MTEADDRRGSQRDWTPDYARRCGVCGTEEDVLAITEWNRGLCRLCLPAAVDRRIFNEVRRRQMIETRDRVGLALSGGKDSAVMLASFAALRGRKPLSLVAIHLDPGLGAYSDRCRAAVEELCRRHAVRLVVESAADYGLRIEAVQPWPVCAVCGAVRRAILPRIARRENLDVLATGHTMEDMLQTMLKQILSGRGFCPKPVLPATPYDPKKIKPLYFAPERVTAAYAEIQGLERVPELCPHFPPDTHRFKQVFDHLESLAPMSKVQVLTNLGRLMKPPPLCAREFTCEDCGEPSRRELCPLCLLRRLQRGETVPFLRTQPGSDHSQHGPSNEDETTST